MDDRLTELVGRGHAAIEASDPRSIEILDSDEWAAHAGAICYAPRYDPAALAALRGRVVVEISVGSISDSFEATVSPTWHRGVPLVFLRDSVRRQRCFAVEASKAAADLPPDLRRALRAPGAIVRVRVMPLQDDAVAPGTLLIVALPIGHQADLSPRATSTLMSCDVILAEDTRVAKAALRWRGVRTPLMSCHALNETGRLAEVRARLSAGGRVALVSDAGTPLISDPGQLVVRAAVEVGAKVTVIPGPSAVIAALTISGLPTIPFRFVGFPPRDRANRHAFFEALSAARETSIVFEAPGRLRALLETLAAAGDDRQVVVARDLTKATEAVDRGTARELSARYAEGDVRGEYTVVVGPVVGEVVECPAATDHEVFLSALLSAGCPIQPIARALSQTTDLSRAQAYELLQTMKCAVLGGGEEEL